MQPGESIVIKLHFNVLRKNKGRCYQPYTTMTYDFLVYNIDKDEKIDFIEKFIQKHDQIVIDTCVYHMPNGRNYNVYSNTAIKEAIKERL